MPEDLQHSKSGIVGVRCARRCVLSEDFYGRSISLIDEELQPFVDRLETLYQSGSDIRRPEHVFRFEFAQLLRSVGSLAAVLIGNLSNGLFGRTVEKPVGVCGDFAQIGGTALETKANYIELAETDHAAARWAEKLVLSRKTG